MRVAARPVLGRREHRRRDHDGAQVGEERAQRVLERQRVAIPPDEGAWQALVDEIAAWHGVGLISMEFLGPVGLPKIERVASSGDRRRRYVSLRRPRLADLGVGRAHRRGRALFVCTQIVLEHPPVPRG